MQQGELNFFKDWTLFLDRDGVLNVKMEDDYVKNVSEFIWIKNIPETLAALSKIFKYIIIVTNQQGIGKGLMSREELHLIHNYIQDSIREKGGKIHAIFYAPQLAVENHPDRKPGIGMLQKAKKLYPKIDYAKSIMVGDSASDMLMATNAGMKKVFIGAINPHIKADYTFQSLSDFYQNLIACKMQF